MRLAVTAIGAALLLAACSSGGSRWETGPAPGTNRGPGGEADGTTSVQTSTAATLGIPPGHLPPPGQCRIWLPGKPPGHQQRPGGCASLQRRVPAGGWLVYRPSKSKKEVRVTVYDERRPVVSLVRIFDVATGRLLREERPSER